MLHIVLAILKILGIIILAILGLVLVLILCVLFVPVRYSARVEYHGRLTVNARVSFLFRIISFRFLKGKDIEMKLRIFGIPISISGEKKEKRRRKKRSKKMEQMDKETEMFEQLSEEIHQESHLTDLEAEEKYKSLQKIEEKKDQMIGQDTDSKQTESESVQTTFKDDSEESEQKTEKSKQSESIFSRIKHFIFSKLLKIKYIFNHFCDTIKDIYGKFKWFKDFITDEHTREAFRLVKKEAVKLLKHIKPRKIKGYLHFGFNSPCTTGKLYGFICMFYTKIPKKFLLQADFENKVLDGDLLIKGRIQMYYLLIIALRLYRNDNLKQVMKKRRTYGRE